MRFKLLCCLGGGHGHGDEGQGSVLAGGSVLLGPGCVQCRFTAHLSWRTLGFSSLQPPLLKLPWHKCIRVLAAESSSSFIPRNAALYFGGSLWPSRLPHRLPSVLLPSGPGELSWSLVPTILGAQVEPRCQLHPTTTRGLSHPGRVSHWSLRLSPPESTGHVLKCSCGSPMVVVVMVTLVPKETSLKVLPFSLLSGPFKISSWIRYFKGRGFSPCFCEFHLWCSLWCRLLRQEESCLTSCCTGILGFWTICQVSLEVWETENAGLPTGWWWNTALFLNNRKHFNYP